MHPIVGIITGHVALNRHLKLIGVKDNSICPPCSEEEETALHFLGQCLALPTIWQCVLGTIFINTFLLTVPLIFGIVYYRLSDTKSATLIHTILFL